MPNGTRAKEGRSRSEDEKRRALSNTQPNEGNAESDDLGDGVETRDTGPLRIGFGLALHRKSWMKEFIEISRIPTPGVLLPMRIDEGKNQGDSDELTRGAI